MSKCKYEEHEIVEEMLEYIEQTYSEHYTGRGGIQTMDLLHSLEISSEYCRGNAIKYLARYGKKEGKNPIDLKKAFHYLVLLIHFERNSEK